MMLSSLKAGILYFSLICLEVISVLKNSMDFFFSIWSGKFLPQIQNVGNIIAIGI